MAGITWVVFGTLASLIWMFRYRETFMPENPLGWFFGVLGLILSVSIGILLHVIATLSDHLHATQKAV
jgi:uncharacterized membrane protein YesL